MKDLGSLRRRAIALMQEALPLLDEAGEGNAASHLQMALDVARRVRTVTSGDGLAEDNPGLPDIPELASDPVLVRAIGGALAVIATLMARKGIAPVSEVARILGIYAVATAETSDEEGLLLACWGSILRDVAYAQDGSE